MLFIYYYVLTQPGRELGLVINEQALANQPEVGLLTEGLCVRLR